MKVFVVQESIYGTAIPYDIIRMICLTKDEAYEFVSRQEKANKRIKMSVTEVETGEDIYL